MLDVWSWAALVQCIWSGASGTFEKREKILQGSTEGVRWPSSSVRDTSPRQESCRRSASAVATHLTPENRALLLITDLSVKQCIGPRCTSGGRIREDLPSDAERGWDFLYSFDCSLQSADMTRKGRREEAMQTAPGCHLTLVGGSDVL